jgi:hypothetical protein
MVSCHQANFSFAQSLLTFVFWSRLINCVRQNYEGYGNSHVSVGPWGGQSGARWDDGVYNTVRQVVICHGATIDSIQFEYDKRGSSVWSEKHGGTGCFKTAKVSIISWKFHIACLINFWLEWTISKMFHVEFWTQFCRSSLIILMNILYPLVAIVVVRWNMVQCLFDH